MMRCEMTEQHKKMIEDNKIRINKQNHWIKKYAKDVFNDRKENTNNKNSNKEKDYLQKLIYQNY